MKLLTTALILTAGLSFGACATVDMMPEQTGQSVQAVDSTDRLALRRSAKTLTYKFERNGWIAKTDAKNTQSAASVLLSGMKAKFTGPQAKEIYIAKTVSAEAVRADIAAANSDIRDLADMAVRVIAADPDAAALRKDLRAMEKALLASRRAEILFEAALIAKGVSDTGKAMSDITGSINALRVVTDALGDRQRDGKPAPLAAS